MSDWLSNLHTFFIRQQPFVVATVVSYHGSSPDVLGACVFYSESATASLVSSESRYQAISQTAKKLLSSQKSHLLEEATLGEVAAHDNSYCDIVYEHFRADEYPLWLTELRENRLKGIDTLLVKQLAAKPGSEVSLVTDTHSYAAFNISSFLQSSDECQLINKDCSPVLMRKVFNTNIQLTIVGSHSVAALVADAAKTLPVDFQQISTTDWQSSDLHKIPAGSCVVIMTGDHELDYQSCQTMLNRSDLVFVGCIGSDRKSELFRQQLHADGMTKEQASRLYMPVGLKEISGKQSAVVATSIIAQILSLHSW